MNRYCLHDVERIVYIIYMYGLITKWNTIINEGSCIYLHNHPTFETFEIVQ
jgi:hypothetical protein